MSARLPLRDPSGAYKRQVAAERRVGVGAKCACGETRPQALIAGSKPVVCADCQRKAKGKARTDDHHFAGQANSPVRIPIWVNDHRAVLNPAQYDWLKQTLENQNGSPLLAGAAAVRGFADTVVYLIYSGLLWVADMLEKLNDFLISTVGPKWWVDTPVAQFAPER